ncbi:M23 family metallopeptidase [Sphingomicrobium marinum]|uniref:M23 family metallopeptidase n=1 Tax=Sphingomicrobium marinum TaxID=1227950 RepID=UPI002240B501|nr:M23 family metallopeptidase [Sphingomicrobium marinum]
MAGTGFFNGIIRDREIYIRDGEKVRRIYCPALVQLMALFVVVFLTAWSGYSAARLATAETAVLSYQLHDSETHAQIAEKQRVLAVLAKNLLDEKIERRMAELEEMGVAYDLPEAIGGPFEASEEGDETFRQLFTSWKKLDHLQEGTIAVPSDMPVKGSALTSSFGTRTDPFKKRRAMHAGIDLAGPSGTPILTTADGKVLRAGYNRGGYGNLIEVDHGNGIVTRYAHLSKIQVAAGDTVRRGQQIGKMGSTGRSTGSHLHYEVRIDGKPVNPLPFMKSTDYLLAMEDNLSMHEIALGGGDGQ